MRSKRNIKGDESTKKVLGAKLEQKRQSKHKKFAIAVVNKVETSEKNASLMAKPVEYVQSLITLQWFVGRKERRLFNKSLKDEMSRWLHTKPTNRMRNFLKMKTPYLR